MGTDNVHFNVFDHNPDSGTLTQLSSTNTVIGAGGRIMLDPVFHVMFLENGKDNTGWDGGNLAIFDISNPSSPRLLRTQAIGGNHAPAPLMLMDVTGRYPILESISGTFESLEYDPLTKTILEHLDWQLKNAWRPGGLLALSPDQKLVISTAYDAQIWVSSRDLETGMLSPLAGPFAIEGIGNSWPGSPVFSPDGKYYIVSDFLKGVVYSYAVDSATGDLSLVSKTACNAGDFYGFLDSTTLLGSEAAGSRSMRLFKYDPASGAVTATGVSVNLPGDNTESVAISSDGRLIYATNASGSQIPTLQVIRFDSTTDTLCVVTPPDPPAAFWLAAQPK